MSETIFSYVILFLVLEFYEIQWQKATTMMGMLARMYQYYAKNIFFFFLKHPTFYFSIYIMMLSNYNIYAVSLFSIKVLDISMKVVLLKQVFIDKKVSDEITVALLAPIPAFLPYIGLVIYSSLVFLALT